jgi:methionine-rich copper-binding protein CopC
MNIPLPASRFPFCALRFALPALLLSVWTATAQPFIVSVVPGRMAANVSPSTTIRFTFSEEMGSATVTVMVVQGAGFEFVTTTPAWSAGNTVLTCTPAAPFPAGSMVVWSVEGEDTIGITMDGDTDYFTISAGGGTGTGCDPLVPMHSFTVSKGWLYQQTSAGSPALDAGNPYCFLACTTIPCPTSATNVSLRTPLGSVANLAGTANPGHLNFLDCSFPSSVALDAAYGTGNYLFTVQATSSNMPVIVNFPTFTQPAAPHISNWAAGQAIDPSKPFPLTWDPMAGGTSADCIYVEIYGGAFKTPALGETGALNGTATSVTIPANTLQPDQTYQGSVTFYHYQILTNGTSYVSLAYRASATEFELNTTAGTGSSLVISNAIAVTATGKFTFDVSCLPNDQVIIERSPSLLPDSWSPIYLTNATTSVVRITDNLAPGNSFYRARKGP